MTRFIPATYSECVHVARRLRALDREEIMPLLFTPTPEDLALHAVTTRRAWCGLADDGEPVVILGWQESRPTVAEVFMFASDRWPEIARRSTVFATTIVKSSLAAGPINRAQCWTLQRHTAAREWLQWLGFRMFGIAADFGPNRETFVGYHFTRSMLEAELVRVRQLSKGENHATGRLTRHTSREPNGVKLSALAGGRE